MRFSDARGRKVVSTSTAETVGRVAELVVDPASERVVAITIRKSAAEGSVLPYDSLTAFGDDAVTVPGIESVVVAEGRLAELADKRHALLGKRVLSMTGDELGKVHDVDFDPADGRVLAVLLGEDAPIEGHRLRAAGSYAVVVG